MITEHIKQTVAQWKDTEEVFYAYYDKQQADEYMQHHLEEEHILSDDEWSQVVRLMDNDEGIWDELNGAFKYALNLVLTKRKGNNGNH